MNRRQFIGVLGGGVFAGCSERYVPDSDTSTTESPTSSPSKRLFIKSTADPKLTVALKLVDLNDQRVAYNETKTVERGDTIRLDSHFEPDADYRFSIDIDGTTVFERNIYSYESYKLAIRSKTTVDITEHAEV